MIVNDIARTLNLISITLLFSGWIITNGLYYASLKLCCWNKHDYLLSAKIIYNNNRYCTFFNYMVYCANLTTSMFYTSLWGWEHKNIPIMHCNCNINSHAELFTLSVDHLKTINYNNNFKAHTIWTRFLHSRATLTSLTLSSQIVLIYWSYNHRLTRAGVGITFF